GARAERDRELLDAGVEVEVDRGVAHEIAVAHDAVGAAEGGVSPGARRRITEAERPRVRRLLTATEELERLERVELRLRRHAEARSDEAARREGEVLNDRAERELVEGAASGGAVTAPARALIRRRAVDVGAERVVETGLLREHDADRGAHRERV